MTSAAGAIVRSSTSGGAGSAAWRRRRRDSPACCGEPPAPLSSTVMAGCRRLARANSRQYRLRADRELVPDQPAPAARFGRPRTGDGDRRRRPPRGRPAAQRGQCQRRLWRIAERLSRSDPHARRQGTGHARRRRSAPGSRRGRPGGCSIRTSSPGISRPIARRHSSAACSRCARSSSRARRRSPRRAATRKRSRNSPTRSPGWRGSTRMIATGRCAVLDFHHVILQSPATTNSSPRCGRRSR